MTKFEPQLLLTPFRMGDLLLPNRIVMAPLTRQRAANSGHVPTLLQAQYYAQRASAGVIISEGTAISPEGCSAELSKDETQSHRQCGCTISV
jgi:2,4-dienoyl-CoA reductase-like NADH-dependent reductase (Old Yellow Enzyme family)